ncbi:unnamed protein product [Oppiella nova]|uniref:Uncharacterized protein n=1 Tax=Oppiella nova TaxID=334625 RepID=A0A7R9QS83_9ACAR|nr:unnamed protein product [Oppiella nova]CAG2173123.1 unnamed protein product [Oppiella nova]
MDAYSTSAKTRITGALMQNYIQKAATLVGDVTKVEPDGKRATIKTTDDQFVQILFAQPLMTPLTNHCLTEVYGIVLSRNQFQCYDYMQFPQEMSDKFDRKTYNDFIVQYIKTCDEHINCMVESNEDNSLIHPIDNFSMTNNYANDTINRDFSFG